MIEQAIAHKIFISRISQRVGFQVRLPKDAKRLIGLEYDARKIYGETSGDPFALREVEEEEYSDSSFNRNRNKVIGKLSLQNTFCEGLFYQGDLIEDCNELHYEGIAARLFEPKPWMQSTRREEIGINVHTGLIQGLFEDCYGLNEYSELEYELTLYFWIEKCTDDN